MPWICAPTCLRVRHVAAIAALVATVPVPACYTACRWIWSGPLPPQPQHMETPPMPTQNLVLIPPSGDTYSAACWQGYGPQNNRPECRGAAVPEPSGAALLVGMVLILFAVRMRRAAR